MQDNSSQTNNSLALIKSVVMLCSLTLLCSCGSPTRSGPVGESGEVPVQVETTPTPDSASEKEDVPTFDDFYTPDDHLRHGPYEARLVMRRTKTRNQITEIESVVLIRNGRVVRRFEEFEDATLRAANFGSVSLLGDGMTQLIVSLTVPRGGRHWVVSLDGKERVLFDSFDYDLGREEVFIVDMDEDGVKELNLPLTAFWGFGTMSMSQSYLPMIVFKFNPQSSRFEPQGCAPGQPSGIEEDISALSGVPLPVNGITGAYQASRMRIFLDLLYSGQSERAWNFLDEHYALRDKEEFKREISARLKREPIYKFLYKANKTRH